MIAGPNWNGSTPSGIDKVITFDTQFGFALILTQLFGPSDLDNVKKIQAGYAAEPLSSDLKTTAPAAAPLVEWLPPLAPSEERTSPEFQHSGLPAAVLPGAPGEAALRQRFANVGIVPGKPFALGSQNGSYVAGMAAGQKAIDAARATMKNANELFGTPQEMQNNYNRRLVRSGESLGTPRPRPCTCRMQRRQRVGSCRGSSKYTIHFVKGGLPPTKAFWSPTMYDLPQQLLVANPLNRYLINSPMLPKLKLDADGGVTLYVQNRSPRRG